MVELLVMRHAKSDWDSGATRDFDRPLAARGHRDAARMAEWLEENDLHPDLLISSSAVRARETAGYVIEQLQIQASDVEFDDDLYHADADDWHIALAGQTANRILICGHNPGLDWLVDFLASAPPPETDDGKLMTTAAIAHLKIDRQWNQLGRGCGHLEALVRPREL